MKKILLCAALLAIASVNASGQAGNSNYRVIYNGERILVQHGNPNSYLKQPFWYKLCDLSKGKKVSLSFKGNLFQYYPGVVDNQPIPFPSGSYNQGGCSPGAAPLKFSLLIQKRKDDGIIDQIPLTSYSIDIGPYESNVLVYFSAQEQNIFPFGNCNQSELYVGRTHDSQSELPANHIPTPLEYSYRTIR